MSEIEKMYKIAGVEYYDRYFSCLKDEDLTCQDNCEICDYAKEVKCYPSFTAEKQLELIKWLAIRLDFGLEYYQNKTWAVQTQLGWDGYEKQYEHKNFDEAISGLINRLWQSLTEAEKQQVKGILE